MKNILYLAVPIHDELVYLYIPIQVRATGNDDSTGMDD